MNHNISFKISPTKAFFIFDLIDGNVTHRSVDNYVVEGNFSLTTSIEKAVVHNIATFGCCVRSGIVPQPVLVNARNELKKFAKQLINKYDFLDDEFVEVDAEEMNIERMPRIGKGKHNIHFDPLFSPHHALLAELAKKSFFSETLSRYMGKLCSLRETGISLTRPMTTLSVDHSNSYVDPELLMDEGSNVNAQLSEKKGSGGKYNVAGEGMEWHSDGAQGEATVLMGVEDIREELGSLRVVPGSHLKYVPGIGHDEKVLKDRLQELASQQVVYEYRAGQPMMIDARTLHSVSRNSSSEWRMIVWFIFDSY